MKPSKNTVRTGVLFGHAVRHPINSVPKPSTQLIESQKKRPERKCSLDKAFVGHGGGGGSGTTWKLGPSTPAAQRPRQTSIQQMERFVSGSWGCSHSQTVEEEARHLSNWLRWTPLRLWCSLEPNTAHNGCYCGAACGRSSCRTRRRPVTMQKCSLPIPVKHTGNKKNS